MVARHLKTAAVGTTTSFAASPKVTEIVQSVIAAVRADGDAAVRSYSEKFDKWSPASFKLSPEQIAESIAQVPDQTIADIREAQHNVRVFAEAQRACITDLEVEIQPGVRLGHRNNPIAVAGAYIPGGRYPLLASAHVSAHVSPHGRGHSYATLARETPPFVRATFCDIFAKPWD